MTDADFDYDPERALWKPGRRSFFFGLGAAIAASFLPNVPNFAAPKVVSATGWGDTTLVVGDVLTFSGVFKVNPINYTIAGEPEQFRVKGIRGSIVDLERVVPSPFGFLSVA